MSESNGRDDANGVGRWLEERAERTGYACARLQQRCAWCGGRLTQWLASRLADAGQLRLRLTQRFGEGWRRYFHD